VFGESADPAEYVAREASDRALGRLGSALRAGAPCALLWGPPGLGKTLLLRVLEQRVRALARPLHLAYASLSIEDLAAWALGLAEEPSAADPVAALARLARAEAARGRALLLLIDEANSMPIETARALGALVAGSEGSLRLALASTDDARASRVVAGLGVEVVEHRFDTPMSEAETCHYVTERLRCADAGPAAWGVLDAARIRGLHALSGGNPRRLHVLAAELLRGEAGRHVLARLEPEWASLLLEPGCRDDTPREEDLEVGGEDTSDAPATLPEHPPGDASRPPERPRWRSRIRRRQRR
jgi:type II secretory pathway predicted ATPase ExeA